MKESGCRKFGIKSNLKGCRQNNRQPDNNFCIFLEQIRQKLSGEVAICLEDNRVFLGNPDLHTERLLLRKYEPGDVDSLFRIYSNPDYARYATGETYGSREDVEHFVSDVIEMYENDEAGEWAVILKSTGKLIGSCGFAWCDTKNSCAQIGFALDPDYRGRGLMTEAVKALLDFGFKKMNLNRIEGFHISGNEASGRVMEKAGMRFEGFLRKKLYLRGEYHDLKIYAALKSDFNKMDVCENSSIE